MFTLVTDRSKYFRVKRGQSGKEVEKALSVPVGECFAGEIISCGAKYEVYTCKPYDDYDAISKKCGVPAEELKKINRNKPVYPTCKIFVPCQNGWREHII